MDILQQIAESLQKGQASNVAELTQKALEQGRSWKDILEKGLFASMEVVGKLFAEEEIFLPEVLMVAKAMNAGVKVLEPHMGKGGQKKVGKVVLGTVKGDLHDLGKKLVNIMLEGAGFEVIDLGVDVPAERFVDAVRSEKAQLVGMSALLTTTMPHMRTVIEALKEAGLSSKVKTIVGGACVTQAFADQIGADAYGSNASDAVSKARKLLGLR
jgi:5-methyltetrahydrofolate--homocysteine methyltransferase